MNVGDKKIIWVTGLQVEGTVIERGNYFTTFQHQPVKWGEDIYTKTSIENNRLK